MIWWSNINNNFNQNDFHSVFEFLKAIKYKNKKLKKYEEFKANEGHIVNEIIKSVDN